MNENEPPPRTESLVGSFRDGAEQAFAPLYERVAPALYAWAVLRAPRGVEPSDLLGETWLQALRSLHRYDPAQAGFRAWIFGIAKKVLLHHLRDLDRSDATLGRRGDPCAGGPRDLEDVPESVTSLSRRFERDESMLRFLEKIDGLPSEERDLVVFCGLEGFTCGEAAVRLGISVDATTKRWQRLRAELRESRWVESLLAD